MAAISAAAAISGIVLGWSARSREAKKEVRKETEMGTALRADMEYLKHGVDDIRIEQRSQGQRLDAMAERLTRVEESAKQAHKRIDRIEQERGER
jgi:ABC-type transport system involved in cytochrome bd biosynthesis fused ATPase/permease subunit